MRKWQLLGSVQLAVALSLASGLPVAAQESVENVDEWTSGRVDESEQPIHSSTHLPIYPSIPTPALTVSDWVAQIEASLVQITGVRVETTEAGLQILLDTADGTLATPATQTVGNALIADIPNAVLALPEGGAFEQFAPAEGIALVAVTNEPGDRVRVAITGTDAPPVAEVTATGLAVTLGEAVVGAEDDAIQVVVTGEQDGYRVPNASVGTRTETPIRDIPASIQVVPNQVIEDQQATRLIDVLENVPGIAQAGVSPRTFSNFFTIRGFEAADNILLNGLPDNSTQSVSFGSNIERVEVLRGPASVLFGQGQIGGIVNLVTKQPLAEPFYSVDASAGSYNFFRGAVDLSGPLNEERNLLYRLNTSAQTTESFIDFYEQQRYLVAPVLTWQISDRTQLTLEAEYSRIDGPFDFGIPAEGSVLPNPNGEIPRSLFVGEPNIDDSQNRVFRVGFDVNHRFSDDWQMRSVFRTSLLRLNREIVFSTSLEDDKLTLRRGFGTQDYNDDIYNFDTYFTGQFTTGNIEHQLVTGFNIFRQDTDIINVTRDISSINIFAPVYGATPTQPITGTLDFRNQVNQYGFYVQDLISFSDNFKLLLGGRLDIASIASQDFENFSDGDFGQETAFSPRVGIVYQPIELISLYASFSRSFNFTSVFSAAEPEPERGTQYEVGVKAELNDRLAANLAFFDLTRSNLPTADPDNPGFSIQIGEQRSRGIEFDISGEILPGWNIIAGYAFTDATITEDNDFEVGNRLNNVPKHAVNLWSTYEIQSGDLQGLGFGVGVFFVGDRQGDLANTFELPGYTRTDASIFYNRDRFRAAINIRNLFDVDGFISAQSRARVFPIDPLTIVGSLSWEF
jgi:iron complex outermembrane receptor protein